jgi:hypothetical protein
VSSRAEQMPKVIIGTPIYHKGAYILDKFLNNQRQIQKTYENCELVLTTSEKEYFPELKRIFDSARLKGDVLSHDVTMPDYCRHWVWDVASGREEIRRFAVSQADADYLLFLDADMLFEQDVVKTMLGKLTDFDAVFNGYVTREHGIGLAGAGCVILNRRVLERIRFRCCEFKNGEVIFEDNLLEMDLFRFRARVRKGIFVASDHYQDAEHFKHIEPQPVGKIRALANRPLVRYMLIKSSLALHYNIPWRLMLFINNLSRDRKQN